MRGGLAVPASRDVGTAGTRHHERNIVASPGPERPNGGIARPFDARSPRTGEGDPSPAVGTSRARRWKPGEHLLACFVCLSGRHLLTRAFPGPTKRVALHHANDTTPTPHQTSESEINDTPNAR